MKAYDVCIFGAGPAGSATAIALAQSGIAPLVFERPHRERAWGGESFSGAIRQPLVALGLWEAFRSANHVASYEQRLAWGGEPWTKDTIFNPLGNLWHVDRGQFDRDLRQAVCERNVPLLDYSHLDELRWDGKEWRIRVDQGAAIRARFLVDATGRARAVGRRLGARPVVHDRLVALASLVPRNPGQELAHTMIIEATPHGWWYAAPIPQGHVLVFLTDSDLAPRDLVRRMRTVSANSVFTKCETDRGWLAVGDACAAYDPLCGWGVCRALANGILAADSIAHYLRTSDHSSLVAYRERCCSQFQQYLAGLSRRYSYEQRWTSHPFWKRRVKEQSFES